MKMFAEMPPLSQATQKVTCDGRYPMRLTFLSQAMDTLHKAIPGVST